MKDNYKLILSNNKLYREIELPKNTAQLVIGTKPGSDVRFHHDMFFEDFSITVMQKDEKWFMSCSDNMYIATDNVGKLITKEIAHGDSFEIRYQASDAQVFKADFFVDFSDAVIRYERAINVEQYDRLRLGSGNGCNIILRDEYLSNETVELLRKNRNFVISSDNTTYGVSINGTPAKIGDRINDGDFFSVANYFFYYKSGLLWTEIRNDMAVAAMEFNDHPGQNAYPKFKRNTRIQTAVNEEEIEILDPPAKPEKPKNNLIMRLMPSMGILVAAGAMAFIGGRMIIFSLISATVAIITAIMTVVESNKDYEKAKEDRIIEYTAYSKRKRGEIEQKRIEEWHALQNIYVSPEVEMNRFRSFSSDLFDREMDDDDFLCVRLGLGSVDARRLISYKKQERLEIEDDLQSIPKQLYDEFRQIDNAPVFCDFKEINALGILGSESCRFELLKNIVIDIAARHYYSDVNMYFVSEEKHKDRLSWLRMLPHVNNEETGTRNIVCNDESRNTVFENIYKELSIREQNKSHDSHMVVFFYDEYEFRSHPISKYVEKAKDLGVTFVFFGETQSEIPQGCDQVIFAGEDCRASLVDADGNDETVEFQYSRIDNEYAANVVQLLAPVYTEEISLEGTLTKSISLFELLNIVAVDDLDLLSRWSSTQVTKSMSAPIGVSTTGVVSLDLHDKAHGPHGLVAGTTGSGKSELLQTYILAMSTLYHPYEVGFVIIDFKGGGMVNQFRELPHLLGAITNIDGKAIDRSLRSIKAELNKRQRLFAEADVNHIDSYIKKYKAGTVKEAIPHLIIIVDEFAELKAEQPEFMKELISASRIGRSLGVHLILATQKPSGQVSEQIWSNSRFKLCLKVQDKEDSNEVIKSPLAAEIKEPGRAYLQVGNNEIFELFQSAYSGAPEFQDDTSLKEFAIFKLTEGGKREPVFVQKKNKSEEEVQTQLDAIVGHLHSSFANMKIPKLSDICLPALEDVIEFPDASGLDRAEGRIIADIGIYDDPDTQYQGKYSVDLTANNVMMIGSAQTGKTNLLQNVIKSLASKYTPEEVNIYIIDFASMSLKAFESLAHVGGVVTASEDEKLKNLMKLIRGEIENRKKILLETGVSSFAAYREAGKSDLPQIVLMIDNLTALKELYFQEDDELISLCREGLSVGVSIIISNSQTAGIGYKYLSNFSCRIAMYCNDFGEYGSLFDHCRERIENIPGRCLIEIEKQHYDCQTYLSFEGEKEIDRVERIREFIADVNSSCSAAEAKKIPVIPERITMETLITEYREAMASKFSVIAGIDYAAVEPVVLKLNKMAAPVVVAGRDMARCTDYLKFMMNMAAGLYKGAVDAYVVDGIDRMLKDYAEVGFVKKYGFLAEDGLAVIQEVEAELAARYEQVAAGTAAPDEFNLIMVVLNSREAFKTISNNMDALNAYRNITGRFKNMGVCIVAGDFENASIPYTAPEVVKMLKNDGQIIFMDDMANMKIMDMPLAVMREFKKPLETGDAYYIHDNVCMKIKTPVE